MIVFKSGFINKYKEKESIGTHESILKLILRMTRSLSILFIFQIVFFSTLAYGQNSAEDASKNWSLNDSVQQVLAVSPRVRAANAELDARKGDLSQAGAIPNPDVELNMNTKLGIEDDAGGADLTQVAVSQPIPLRLSRQRKQAKAIVEVARQNVLLEQLSQEAETARRFHALQFTTAMREQAEEQLQFAMTYQKNNQNEKKDPLVRFMTPLEQKRLAIVSASARQEVATAEGKYSEALSGFKMLLQIPPNSSCKTEELKSVASPRALEDLLALQEEKHPAFIAARQQVKAAEAGIKLAYGELFPDPKVKAFGERDFLADSRRNFYGVALTFQVPIWDWKLGSIKKAKSETKKLKFDFEALKQDLQSQLRENHLHLGHLIEQAKDYQTELLAPAKEVFELTQKGFEVGEANVLALIDSQKTYFDARKGYLELLSEENVELAELRLNAGLSLVDSTQADKSKGSAA